MPHMLQVRAWVPPSCFRRWVRYWCHAQFLFFTVFVFRIFMVFSVLFFWLVLVVVVFVV